MNKLKENVNCDSTYAYFSYGLVRQYKPKTVIEVGLGPEALAAHSILCALEENDLEGNKGKFFSIEHKPTSNAVDQLHLFNRDLWELRVQDSMSIGSWWCGEKADIVFIDSEHDFEHAYKDGQNAIIYAQLNLMTGILVYHDVLDAQTRAAIEKLRSDYSLNCVYLNKIDIAILTQKTN